MLDRALQTTRLSIISRHYGLARKRLVGDPSALPALQRSETVQAHVFQAYIAGLILENGYATTQRWVTQAMRETAAEMYDALKREEEAKVGPKSTPSSSALGRVMEWIQKNKLEHEFTYLIEGKPPEQIFHCTLAFEGQVCKGQGASKQEARQR